MVGVIPSQVLSRFGMTKPAIPMTVIKPETYNMCELGVKATREIKLGTITGTKISARPMSTNVEETNVLLSARNTTYHVSKNTKIDKKRLTMPASNRYGVKTKVANALTRINSIKRSQV
jgi:hypothetical protein